MRHPDAVTGMYLNGYRWLNKWGKTPVDLGLVPPGRIDPRWYEAMETIDAALAMIQSEKRREA